MKTISAVAAAGDTHPGLQREVNEDRFHCDPARGLFVVVDGIGGQAAGGKAADVAMETLRARLERETGTVADRVREAITVANNEILRVASTRPEWHGMACVLTVVVVDEGRAVVGHVGDTRLYTLRDGQIEKVTRDHSPVGEREDSHEISETAAMRHPRRNEVYRDVGSEPHDSLDPDFIDLNEIPFEPDAALLLCSDGLTDLVDSTTIREVVTEFVGRPREVVRELIQAANDAGGKDNVTVVYVEGEQFAASCIASEGGRPKASRAPSLPARGSTSSPRAVLDLARPEPVEGRARSRDAFAERQPRGGATRRDIVDGGRNGRSSRRLVRLALVGMLAMVAGYALFRSGISIPLTVQRLAPTLPSVGNVIVVTPSDSIAAALASAPRGGTVVVEPGEYREQVVLTGGVRLVSRVPRAATLRLPGTASEGDPAVVADGVAGAELAGVRIVGDAATPLGTGIFARNADVSVVDVEITGAANAAIEVSDAARLTLLASHVHDNPGAALAIRSGASPRVSHNLFARNGLSGRAGAAFVIDPRDPRDPREPSEPGSEPIFFGNVFQGLAADAFRALGDRAAERTARDNWFMDARDSSTRSSSTPHGRRGR